VVHTLTLDRCDQPFGKAVLPGRGWRGRLVPDAHGAQSACDDVAIDPIPIADEVARSFIPRKGLRYWTFVAALMSVAAVGMSKNRLSRRLSVSSDFRLLQHYRPIPAVGHPHE